MTQNEVKFTPIEEAIERFGKGEYIVVMDDESRENEGDVVMAAQHATPEKITFALKHTSGILCAPMTVELARHYELPPMVKKGTDPNGTAFTVTIDHVDTSTGVSSRDRSVTFKALASGNSKAEDYTRPGHVFPLVARSGGILERRGHTEATVDLCILSGCEPVGLLAEIVNEDGTMSRLLDCYEFAVKYNLAMITVEQLAEYRASHPSSYKVTSSTLNNANGSTKKNEYKMEKVARCRLPIQRGDSFLGDWDCTLFHSEKDGITHTVLSKGNVQEKIEKGEAILMRLHSECFTGNTLGSLRCDCGEQLDLSLKAIEEKGTGLVIYLGGHEGRGIGLINKVKAYHLQDEESLDTYEANIRLGFEKDLREYDSALEIIKALGIKKLNLMTNNKWKYQALNSYIDSVTPLVGKETQHNAKYLEAKRKEHGVVSKNSSISESQREVNSPAPLNANPLRKSNFNTPCREIPVNHVVAIPL